MENLNQMGLVELDEQTLQKNGSGIVAAIALGLLGAAIYDCLANHETFVEGFKEGYNS